MKYILSRACRPVIERFTRSNVLMAFDFDGTLARIVREPSRAAMRASTRALLAALARHHPLVVVSGRSRADVARRLDGVSVVEVIGNHGIEPWLVGDRTLGEVRRWQPVLEEKLGRRPDVRIENKGFSVAIHYRRSPNPAATRAVVRRAITSLGRVRVVPGKAVVNLLPRGAADKGAAIEEALSRLGCDTAVYVGDDTTDEDVFALDRPSHLLTIRVGRARESLAPYFIRSQAEIDALLLALLGAAGRRPGLSEAPRSGRRDGRPPSPPAPRR
jgi:trehalose 6-phosphate phosphatase